MNIISRYITKELLANFFLGIFVLVSVYLTIDFLGRVWEFLDANVAVTLMLEYFLTKTPWVIYNMIPIACLIATLITFSDFSKNNEMIAMYAGGISLWRIALLIISIGLMVTAGTFILNEYIVPPTMARARYIRQVHLKKRNYQAFKKSKIWYRSKNLIYNLHFFEPGEKLIQGITIYYFDDDFNLTKQIFAGKAIWISNNWTLYDGTEIDFEKSNYPRQRYFKQEVVYLPERPEDLIVIEKSTDTVSFSELRDYVQKSKRAGLKSRVYEVDMHAKIAMPFACIIMMLLALPFAIKHKRTGGMAVNLGYTFVFVLLYVFIQAIAISHGHSGKINPVVSAWLPDLIFLIFSAFAISKTQR